MKSILFVRKIRIYFLFYYHKFLIPFLTGLFAITAFTSFLPIIIILTFVSLFMWFYNHYLVDDKKQKLYFYFNLGIGEFQLYSFVFVLNLSILILLKSLL